MKKILFTAVSALAMSAAIAADSTQFGVLPVNSGTKRTLVAVPWVEASTGGTPIAVSNLVLTANLAVGDTLDVLDGSGKSLNRWILAKGANDVLYWNSVTMVTEGDNKGSYTSSTPSASAATIERGSAVVLIRNSGNLNDPFYVMGQVAATAGSTTIAEGSEKNPCYNMIAPPSTVAQGLNGGDHGATWEGTINEADRIFIPASPLNIELKYDENVWKSQSTVTTCKYFDTGDGGNQITEAQIPDAKGRVITNKVTSTQWAAYTGTIKVGTGFWYLSRGGTPTVTWKDVPVTKK